MPKNKIETELMDATALKRKVAEKPQLWMTRLIKAVQDLPEDEWDKISEPAQLWVNGGAKAIKGEKEVPAFPGEEPEEDEEDAKPARRGRAAAAAVDEEEEEEKPSRKSSRRAAAAEEEEEEEKPARRGRAAAVEEEEEEEKPARRSTRRAARDEDEEEEKPARRGRAARDEDEDEDKPKKAAVKRGDGEVRKVGAQTQIKKMLAKKPSLSTEELLERLEKQGYHPTPLAVSSIRSGFRNTVKILNEAGLCDLDLG